MRKRQITLIVLGILALGLTAFGLHVYSIAESPDFEIKMVRPIPSKLGTDVLDQALNSFENWPAWFHSAVSLTQVDEHGNPIPKESQVLKTGDYLKLGLDTKRGLHGKYFVTLRVTDYTPRKRLVMHVLDDSKNKLTRVFDSLDWAIELTPQPGGTLITGTATAHTHTWRARVFGKLIPKILLNQVYYPDLMVLAEITNPNVVYPDPSGQHGGM